MQRCIRKILDSGYSHFREPDFQCQLLDFLSQIGHDISQTASPLGRFQENLIPLNGHFESLQPSCPAHALTGLQVKAPSVHRTGDYRPVENTVVEALMMLVMALI